VLKAAKVRQVASIWYKLINNFEYISDRIKFKKIELWDSLPKSYKLGDKIIGDCEEIARASCKVLRRKGFQARLLYCKTETGGGHLVCETGGSSDY